MDRDIRSDAQIHLRRLRKIERLVKRFLSRHMDRDNVAGDIWMECYVKDVEPSWKVVRHRCIDAIRRKSRRRTVAVEDLSPEILARPETRGTEIVDAQDEINGLMVGAELTGREKKVMFMKYYQDLTNEQVGLMLGLTKARIGQIDTEILMKLGAVR